mgnify:CR=1 FL=1
MGVLKVQQTVRIPAFDAARSVMMLLGLAVHTFLVIDFFQPNLSVDEKSFFASAYQFIHVFRMPVFFIIGGFFSAYLILQRGSRAFVVSRFKRVVSPLLAAEFAVASVVYLNGCTWCANPSGPGLTGLLSNGWLYLWFLFYLALISHAALLAHLVTKRLKIGSAGGASRWSLKVSLNPAEIAVFALLATLLPNVLDEKSRLRVVTNLIPDLSVLAFFALLFWTGWLAYKNSEMAIEAIRKWWLANLLAGVLATLIWPVGAIWFISFGVLGGFLRFANRSTKTMQYLSDASYWIYLVHPPLVIGLLAVLGQLGWPVAVTVLVEMALTLIITLGSYHFVVRYTVIGKWLSGRRRPTRKERMAQELSANPALQL